MVDVRHSLDRWAPGGSAEIGQIARFCVVGAVGAVVYVSGTALFLFLGVNNVIASILGQMVGGCLFYFGHGLVTFRIDPRRPVTIMRFLAFAVGSLAFNAALTWSLLNWGHFSLVVVVAIVTVAVPVVNYLASRFWVFRQGAA